MPMSTKKLVALAREREELAAAIKDLEAKKKAIDVKIIADLDARETKSLETDEGVVITKAANLTHHYDFDALAEEIGQAKAVKMCKNILDPAKLSAAVQAGKLDPMLVERIHEEKYSAAYVRVSGAK